jgi:putative ribosome biogenesis GTPase RsgA
MNKEQGIKSVIILNKIDLISKEDLDLMIFQIKKRFGDM